MSWNRDRENVARLWVRQLVSLSFLYVRASKWMRVLAFTFNFWGVFGGIYAIPAYGCSLVSDSACFNLLVSGMVTNLIAGMFSGLALAYSPENRAVKYDSATKELLSISRVIGLELQKLRGEREDPSAFAQSVVTAYEGILQNVPLPWYITGEEQLANLSLIQSYSINENSTQSTESDDDDSTRPRLPAIQMTEQDYLAREKITEQLNRMGFKPTDFDPDFNV